MGKNSRIRNLRKKIKQQAKEEKVPSARMAERVFANKQIVPDNKSDSWYDDVIKAARLFLKLEGKR